MGKRLLGSNGLSVLLALALSACGGSGGSGGEAPKSLADSVRDAETANTLPRQVVGDSLVGQDTDNNGVRDDLDRFIAAKPYSQPQRLAVIQLAAALRSSLLVADGDVAAARAAGENISLQLSCLYQRFPATSGELAAYPVALQLEGASFNTVARLRKYEQFNAMLAGTSVTLEDVDVCLS